MILPVFIRVFNGIYTWIIDAVPAWIAWTEGGGGAAESGVEAGESPKLPEQIKTPLKREAY